MAMLAGPRRKQKVINLRAKNSEWSNDPNKFGQRMLEKMGWSSGKGLGAKENGMVEHVVARYKNDEKGLGFEDKNDQWTKHEDDFNALLANLSNGDKTEVALHSGVSLEVKSKKSKARVHYHKFTRGKDLTRYSEKDLANIFGKKTLKNEGTVEEPVNEDIQSTEQVFTEKGSMEDYFKNKLRALKSKSSLNFNVNVEKEDYEAEYSFQGFAGTSEIETRLNDHQDNGFQGFSFYNTEIKEEENSPIDSTNLEIKKSKKKKKSKKHDYEEIQTEISTEKSDDHTTQNTEFSESVKKKKLKKSKQDTSHEIETEVVKTKKKKSEIEIPAKNDSEEDSVPKKKKKRKNK